MKNSYVNLKFLNSIVGKVICAIFTSTIAGIVVYYIIHPTLESSMVQIPAIPEITNNNTDTLLHNFLSDTANTFE